MGKNRVIRPYDGKDALRFRAIGIIRSGQVHDPVLPGELKEVSMGAMRELLDSCNNASDTQRLDMTQKS